MLSCFDAVLCCLNELLIQIIVRIACPPGHFFNLEIMHDELDFVSNTTVEMHYNERGNDQIYSDLANG